MRDALNERIEVLRTDLEKCDTKKRHVLNAFLSFFRDQVFSPFAAAVEIGAH